MRSCLESVSSRSTETKTEVSNRSEDSTKAVVQDLSEEWSKAPFLGPMDDSTLKNLFDRYSAQLSDEIDQELKPIAPIDGELKHLIIRALLLYMVKDILRDETTGIVIAGFGNKDLFPVLVEYKVEGVVHPNILRVRGQEAAQISTDNSAQIVPFAQAEMVHSFMTGTDPKLRANIEQVFGNLLDRFSSLLASELSGTLTPDELSKLSGESNKAIAAVVQEFQTELNDY